MSEPQDENSTPNINVQLGSPYIAKSLKNLNDSAGEPLPTEEVTALCRCGHSSNKPYCDGTHLQIGFVGEKEDDRVPDAVDEYEGVGITIVDNRGVCSHAGICTDNLPKVFKLGVEPWIDPAGATVKEIMSLGERGPSGALSYKIDGVCHQDHGGEPAVKVTKNGPYYITGGVELTDDQGSEPEADDHYALCRCGKSKNKPFCNGAHWDGFEDSGTWKGSGSE